MQSQMLRLAHDRLKVVESVGDIFVRQDQTDDVDIGASRETVDDWIGHLLLLLEVRLLPERLIRFVDRLLPRQPEVIEKMQILGKVAERGALPTAFIPAQ